MNTTNVTKCVGTLLAAAALCAASAAPLRAAPGDIDPTFADGGLATLDFGRGHALTLSALVQDDGKIVVLATTATGDVLVRFAGDGTLDPAFGSGGLALERPPGWTGEGARAALQGDGRIVVVGQVVQGGQRLLGVARFLADGGLDTSFPTAGIDVPSGRVEPTDVALQPDGKIVIATGDFGDLALVRLEADGTPDASFGSNGTSVHALTPRGGGGWWLALQDDGRIVVAGRGAVESPVDRRVVVARFLAGGTLDPSFGDGGSVITAKAENFDVRDVLVQADGGIVVVGDRALDDRLAVRFTVDGQRDESFGRGGTALPPEGREFWAYGAAVAADGDILIAGALRGSTGLDVLRLQPDGRARRSFGEGGFLSAPIGDISATAHVVVLGSEGEIVLGGQSRSEHDADTTRVAVARFAADGRRDEQLGTRGVATFLSEASNDFPVGVFALPDGRIVVAGSTSGGGTGRDLAVARLNADGSPDEGFGTDGMARIDSSGPDAINDGGPINDGPAAAALQPDLRVVGAGSWHDGQDGFNLVRATAIGDLDVSFGNDGGLRLNSSCDRYLHAVAVAEDGAILAAGAYSRDCGGAVRVVRVTPHGMLDAGSGMGGILDTGLLGTLRGTASLALAPDGAFLVGGLLEDGAPAGAVARYDEAGTPDPGFGTGGVAAIALEAFASGVAELVVERDGSVLAAAEPGSGDFVLVRLDPAGEIDPSFGDGGVAAVDFDGGDDRISSIVVQSDGKILLGGTSLLGPAWRPVVARLTADGLPDGTFGSDGEVVLPVGPAMAWSVALAIEASGGIVVTFAVGGAEGSDFAVMRLLGDSSSVCGNGVLEPAELCDDGNADDGDGCTSSCSVESCYRCAGEQSACVPAAPEDPACEPVPTCPTSTDPGYTDSDGDVRADACDHCPGVATASDDDSDHDGVGDACDLCPLDFDPANQDLDGDGVGDACDRCTDASPLVAPRLLRLTGLDTPPGDDRLILRGSFAVASGTTLESLVASPRLEVRDASGALAFSATLAGQYDRRTKSGWRNTADLSWPWRYTSHPNAFPKIRAKVRMDPDDPSRVQIRLIARRGGFASLEPVLPLGVKVAYGAWRTCAKSVYLEDGEPPCELVDEGAELRCR